MRTKKELVPAIAIHPGETIKDELEAREMSQAELASLIGMEKTQLNEVIKGKRNITADMAILLEKALGIDADYWMTAQKNYELDLARIDEKNQAKIQQLEEWNIWKEQIPVSFLKKHKFLTGSPKQDVETVKQIYAVQHVDQLANFYASSSMAHYKKANTDKADRRHILGWTKLISFLGSQQKVVAFKHQSKDDLIDELRSIISKNENVVDKSTELLASVGIKLVIHKNADKCPVDGVCLWNGKNPLIGMSMRYSRLDNFAFTLFHELGHVYLHLVNNPDATFVDDLDDIHQRTDMLEREANDFAANSLIPENDWETFITSDKRMQDEFTISFAQTIGIHPAIVKGRLKHELNSFSIRTKISNEIE
jgi:HTH-type transcriptional regulator/antitoxin HigA